MNPADVTQPWLPLDRIAALVQVEPALATIGMLVIAGIVYKGFMGGVNQDRHENLRRLFRNVLGHLIFGASTFIIYRGVTHGWIPQSEASQRLAGYLGFACVISWATIFVKVSRILLFEYLFLSHMKVGVPLLLVNMFTLLLCAIMAGWMSTVVFNVQIAPVLATSAIFSLVLGLALQDTLGNLFSGVAMQIDKPYEIGDWIEISLNGQKWVGQVWEISWRATILIGLGDESITVPNRLMGQTQISNFSTKRRPITRSQVFRVPYGTPIEEAKKVLVEAARSVPVICQTPGPIAVITETTESWLSFKLIYFIRDYGAQLVIGDRVLTACTDAMYAAGYELASPRILVVTENKVA